LFLSHFGSPVAAQGFSVRSSSIAVITGPLFSWLKPSMPNLPLGMGFAPPPVFFSPLCTVCKEPAFLPGHGFIVFIFFTSAR